MACRECRARGKTWEGDDPRCAFETGVFSPDNWNCALANELRNICSEEQDPMPEGVDYRFCGSQKYATVYTSHIEDLDARALWVSWYKRRGKTEAMWLLNEHGAPRLPTEAECRLIVADYLKTDAG